MQCNPAVRSIHYTDTTAAFIISMVQINSSLCYCAGLDVSGGSRVFFNLRVGVFDDR
jgi:hypothetical protein